MKNNKEISAKVVPDGERIRTEVATKAEAKQSQYSLLFADYWK